MNNTIGSIESELNRKFIHICSSIFPILYFFLDHIYFLTLLILSTTLILFINLTFPKYVNKIPFISQIIHGVLRNYEKTSMWGASYMLIAFTIIATFFPKNIVILSMLITSVSDSIAAVVGIKYGKIKLINNRTLEGSFAFLITSYILMYFILNTNQISVIIYLSFLLSITELVTPTKFDNFSVPILCSILIFYIGI